MNTFLDGQEAGGGTLAALPAGDFPVIGRDRNDVGMDGVGPDEADVVDHEAWKLARLTWCGVRWICRRTVGVRRGWADRFSLGITRAPPNVHLHHIGFSCLGG